MIDTGSVLGDLEQGGLPTARLLVQLLAARDAAEIDRLIDAFDHCEDTVRVELNEGEELASVDVSALLAGAHLALGVAVALGAKGSKTSRRKLVAAMHHRLGLAVPR